MNGPLISVVICTYNRADLLRTAIESVVEQDYPREEYEVVVVDNASTDHTPRVVAEFAVHHPQVRYVHEPVLRANIARNKGWRSARGTYVAYLDDDAIAEPGWLAAVRDGFAAAGSTPAIIGGRIDPIWLAERPLWLSDPVAAVLTIIDWGPNLRPLTEVPKEWLAATNLAMPAALLQELGGFDPRLGRSGSKLLSNDEILIMRQAQQRGYVCLYHPQMRVRHLVPTARLRQRWFVRRYYWQGISDAVMELIETAPTPRRRVRRAAVRMRRLLRSPGVLRDLLVPTRDPQAFTRKCFAWIEIGHIAGLLGIARQ